MSGAMNILVACESSARVRDAFIARGHNAWSCDLKPTLGRAGNHLQGDVRWAIDGALHKFPQAIDIRTGRQPLFRKWDMLIAFPECRFMAASGLWRRQLDDGREELTEEALAFVVYLMECDIPRIAIENPVGVIATRILEAPDLFTGSRIAEGRRRQGTLPASQVINPYEFGDDASKTTCLWLKNLPLLKPTKRIAGRMVEWPPGSGRQVERWSNQTDSGNNKLGPGKRRAALRGYTYPGIANAMGDQWGRVWLKAA
jgi:hypothetical protein